MAMKNYLSFGGGVNSVAMYLYLLDEKWDFEAVFVDHGTDWPETYEYVDMFKKKYPLTIIKPDNGLHGDRYNNLYDYALAARFVPTTFFRWCTKEFKVRPIHKYYQKPCFNLLGIDFGESHRARLGSAKGIENRYPLIEAEIDRDGCKEIIRKHELPVPMRSGCYICPFQRIGQWKELRRRHPCLFQKAVELEEANIKRSEEKGKPKRYISNRAISLSSLVAENQIQIFKQDEYPPCECML